MMHEYDKETIIVSTDLPRVVKGILSKWEKEFVDNDNRIKELSQILTNRTHELVRTTEELCNKEEEINKHLDFVIAMWENPHNEMDVLHTLKTLKGKINEIFKL